MNFFCSVLAISAIGLIAHAFPERSQILVEDSEPKIEDVPYVPDVKSDSQNEPAAKVSYASCQLWNVDVESDEKKQIIAFLRDHKGEARCRRFDVII